MNCSNFKVFHSNFLSDEIINRDGGVLQGAPPGREREEKSDHVALDNQVLHHTQLDDVLA